MKRTLKMTAMAIATAAATFGLVGQAQADAYAYSSNTITNFLITGVTFQNSSTTSAGSSTLNGVDESFSGALDTAPAYNGTGTHPANNVFSALGQINNYGRGDALISNPNVLAAPGGAANNVAEAFVTSGNRATGDGTNILSGSFTVGEGGTTLNASMTADPFMEVWLNGSVSPGSFADATMSFTMTILSAINGSTVAEWTVPAIDHVMSALELGDHFTYDPAAENYTFGTNLLAGDYRIAINMAEGVSVQSTTIPEPGSIALLGMGLACLGFMRNRKA